MIRQNSCAPLPFAITKKRAARLLGSPKLLDQMLFWSRPGRGYRPWLKITREGGRGRELLIDYLSLAKAYRRYMRGKRPGLLPSQSKRK